jgi:4-alpha-glucanotransferase
VSRLEELRRVAELVGIGTRHYDALGRLHEPGEETLSRLITAFGLPPEPYLAAEALAEEERSAPFGLTPVQIIDEDDAAPTIQLRLPPQSNDTEWHCRCETGEQFAGRSDGSALVLPGGLALGYHRLSVGAGSTRTDISLVVAPRSCHLPDGLRPGSHSWGLTAQLYGLREQRDWGIGDFTGLGDLCRHAGRLGAAVVGVNPLHALFAAEPRHFSPYSPSSRGWLNYLYIDVTAVPGFAEVRASQSLPPVDTLKAAHRAELVDYAAVAALKRPALEALFRWFGANPDGMTELAASFAAFRQESGAALAEFAVFEALHEHFSANGSPFSWHEWPAAMRDPHSPEVAEFARAHAERIAFFEFLQWQADRQLRAAAETGRQAGLGIGLYRDLAVGVNPNGAEAWADATLVVPGAAIGAPPDPLSRAGQDWGLAPLNPLALRRRGFTPLIAALRANMRHAGILRIDHVMGLQRLYWVPAGSPATAGAYVNYPFRDLLRLLALESRRQHCAVVGEDLGTVAEGFRETMQTANVLSYRIVFFERRGDGGFTPPAEYPSLAAASAATHDLATLRGYWIGRDIDWRRRLGLYPDAAAEATELADRRRGRYQLLEALASEKLLTPEQFEEWLPADGEPFYTDELGEAIMVYLARARARLTLVQLEDVVGDAEQANLPGTTDAHPNWRRRLPVLLDQLLTGPALAHIAALINEARRHTPPE